MKIQIVLDPQNKFERVLIRYLQTVNPKKPGMALKSLLRSVVIEKCFKDPEWRVLYCKDLIEEPVEVDIV
ncbi:MAG: hypothetical protein DRJ47_11015 [Thermoprotei archaeon]|nr:MAG: hypothetical protein DRJ47_11015 [Thermoprotei archaeon]